MEIFITDMGCALHDQNTITQSTLHIQLFGTMKNRHEQHLTHCFMDMYVWEKRVDLWVVNRHEHNGNERTTYTTTTCCCYTNHPDDEHRKFNENKR